MLLRNPDKAKSAIHSIVWHTIFPLAIKMGIRNNEVYRIVQNCIVKQN